jgi:hypothetical protein
MLDADSAEELIVGPKPLGDGYGPECRTTVSALDLVLRPSWARSQSSIGGASTLHPSASATYRQEASADHGAMPDESLHCD